MPLLVAGALASVPAHGCDDPPGWISAQTTLAASRTELGERGNALAWM
jgi:hypothetical protein